MASSYYFFLLLLFFASQVNARESKFFSKVTHNNANQPNISHTKVPDGPTPAPAPYTEVLVPSPAPSSDTDERENGYGLYGQGEHYNEQFHSTKEIPTTAGAGVESELLSEEFTGDEGFETEIDESEFERRRESGDRVLDKGKYYSGPVKKNYYYGNNGYDQIKPIEKQGMSDTRFLENGRYFHDLRNENNNNNHNNNYYNGYDQTAQRNSRYEFDSMEEYERYQESQGYVP